MLKNSVGTIINVTAVIVTVTDDIPRVLIIDQDPAREARTGDEAWPDSGQYALPNGPVQPEPDEGRESFMRPWVGGQQGRGELDPLEAGMERLGQRLGQGGLAHARQVVQQDVALAEESQHGHPDDVGLRYHDLQDIVRQSLDPAPELLAYGAWKRSHR